MPLWPARAHEAQDRVAHAGAALVALAVGVDAQVGAEEGAAILGGIDHTELINNVLLHLLGRGGGEREDGDAAEM